MMYWSPTNISLSNFQKMLTECLFGDLTDEHLGLVVPRQGNLLNPQQLSDCSAYFTFYNSSAKKIMPNRDIGKPDIIATLYITIELQAVGINAEMYMLSTLFWDNRADIREIFDKYRTQLVQTEREIMAVPYYQDGDNMQLSYNTTLSVISSLHMVDTTEHKLQQVLLQGKLKQGEDYA